MIVNKTSTQDDVKQAMGVLEQYIQSVLSETSENQVDSTVTAQLREITKTIERLEKLKIPVPDSLLTEKSNLLSLIVQTSVSTDLVNEVYTRLNVLLESITSILKLSKNGERAKSRRSKLPMTKHQILRECIVNALEKLGGVGKRKEIIESVGNQLKDVFLPGDIEWREDWKCYVWQNRVCWELTDMRIAGILKPKKKTGIWELDDSYKEKG